MQAIPTPKMDLIFNTLADVRKFPNQGDLVLGWNVSKVGTFLVTDVGEKYRVQHWPSLLVKGEISNAIGSVGFEELITDFADWMFRTFPGQTIKGKLEHLKLEADEAIASPNDILEYADCLMLSVGAALTAKFTLSQLVNACRTKLAINKARLWNAPVDAAGPVLHVVSE